MATLGLGDIQLAENQLDVAAETFQRVLRLLGDPPLPVASEAHLGLARIFYEWNDLAAAERHGRQSLHLARQYGRGIDRSITCDVFLARLKLAQGDVTGASALLVEASQSVREGTFVHRVPEVAAAQVLTLLHQGKLAAAAHLAEAHDLPISQARVHLAHRDPVTALTMLGPVRQQADAKGWADEQLTVMVLQAIAHHVHGEKDKAVQVVSDALALAEPGGFIRLFVDEGPPMAQLLSEAAARGIAPEYTQQVLAAFSSVGPSQPFLSRVDGRHAAQVEPLSKRELEVLQHIAEGLSNQEIASRLSLSLHTVKVHSRTIYGKLSVHNRTQAVARARALGMLHTV